MSVSSNVLDLIGNTPMLELSQLDTGPCRLFGKLELMNPGGSIKDRIGLAMIEGAERDGHIKPGDTLVEATAGNTGISLALVAAQKGYRMVIVMPDKMSMEKVFNLKAMGAEVVLTRSDVPKGHPEQFMDLAERIAKDNGWFFVNQFANEHNARAHEEVTGPEIWEQMDHDMDAVICGVGSGGTITGFQRYFGRVAPDVDIVLADPEGSIVADFVKTGELGKAGSWVVEGIGEDYIPPVCKLDDVHTAYTIPDAEALLTARELLLKEGILVGSSTGTLLAAALRYCREQTEPKRVVTLLCDTGNKYLSKMFNDFWMIDRGYLDKELHGDLRDFVARPHAEKGTTVIGISEPMTSAQLRMRDNGLSQLPVMDEGTYAGLVDERSMMQALQAGAALDAPVREAMRTDCPVLDSSESQAALEAALKGEPTVVVMHEGGFAGLVTRSDWLVWRRKQG
jgi:cystathionine beta-synthase